MQTACATYCACCRTLSGRDAKGVAYRFDVSLATVTCTCASGLDIRASGVIYVATLAFKHKLRVEEEATTAVRCPSPRNASLCTERGVYVGLRGRHLRAMSCRCIRLCRPTSPKSSYPLYMHTSSSQWIQRDTGTICAPEVAYPASTTSETRDNILRG